MAEVIETADEFQTKVLEAKTPVLVDFFATWCGPCRMVAPVIDEIATEKAGQVAVYKVDIDQSLQPGLQVSGLQRADPHRLRERPDQK